MGDADPIDNMRERAKLCRRLADSTHDRSVAETLLKMATEIEADIDRLQSERRPGPG